MATMHWGPALDVSGYFCASEIWPGSFDLLDSACCPLPHSCGVDGRVEGDESDRGAGRLLSCCGDCEGGDGEGRKRKGGGGEKKDMLFHLLDLVLLKAD